MPYDRIPPDELLALCRSKFTDTGKSLCHKAGRRAGCVAGGRNTAGRLIVDVAGRGYPAELLLHLMRTGVMPAGRLDHLNGDRTDNRADNLRELPPGQRSLQHNNTSGVPGVWRNRFGRWVASYKSEYLGTYRHKADAVKARRDAEADAKPDPVG